MRETNDKLMPKTFYLQGLDCAFCARKIEYGLRALPGVSFARVDFAGQKLTLGVADEASWPELLFRVKELIAAAEPDVKVSDYKNKSGAQKSGDETGRARAALLAAGAAMFAGALALDLSYPANLAVFLASYLLVGGDVLLRAARNLARGEVLDENFLMSAATIGAFVIGEYPEGVAVMLFYQVGEFCQRKAVERARGSIAALMDIRPDFANLKTPGGVKRVTPEEVKPGDLIVIRPGEKAPLDGVVVEGFSAFDASALTGESLPRDVGPGSAVLSGAINLNGLLTVEVAREFGESTVKKILDLVESASEKKAPAENFITKFSRHYTPCVVFAAALLAFVPPLVWPGAVFAEWAERALVFLVISCPCALVISVPLSFFGGIGGASRQGILIKGGNYLDALSRVDTVVFDKTGTLTKGVFNVISVTPSGDLAKDGLLFYAAGAESHSTHPIALSIRKACKNAPEAENVTEAREIAGQGVSVRVAGLSVLAGNDKLMKSAGVTYKEAESPGTVVYVAVDGKFAGHIEIADELKPDSAQAVAGLKSLGVRRAVMLTGDSRAAAGHVADALGLDQVYAQLLPHEKIAIIEKLEGEKTNGGVLIFVGDGINDAPALVRADAGVAMGGLGSDAAIEAADIVIMTDEPSKILTAINIARKTKKIVWQNIVLALGVKAVVLAMGALGLANMWAAVFSDVGVSLLAIFNALRALRV
ncbi:MAG: cadmium-translocating P-type ATPase [Acidaminococcales bacterium]|jgi:Cd2+/Zn2+-exporting ATPase|nr:cadmium-translocating P-type ATPase [Acidaminococcales bacterium]